MDKFKFLEIVDDNGRKVMRSIVTTDVFQGSTVGLLHCFVKPFDPESGTVADNLYSLKKEYKYFVHKSVTGNDQLWKLFLPLEVTSYAVRDELEDEVEKVIYGWTAMEHPFVKKVNSYLSGDGPGYFHHKNHYYPYSSFSFGSGALPDSDWCALNAGPYYVDEVPRIPALEKITVVRDGNTYVATMQGFKDHFGYPDNIQWSAAGGVSISTELALKESYDPGNKLFYLGQTAQDHTRLSFPGGEGYQGVYNLDWDESLNLESMTGNQVTYDFKDGYDGLGNLTMAKDPRGNVDSFTNHSFGRPKNISLGGGEIEMELDYDPRGGVSEVVVDGNTLGELTYDPLGAVATVERPGYLYGSVAGWLFNKKDYGGDRLPEFDFHIAVTAREVSTGNRVYNEEYDGWGRVWRTNVYEAGGAESEGVQSLAGYDACGNLRWTAPAVRGGEADVDFLIDGVYIPEYIGTSYAYYDAFGRPVYTGADSGDMSDSLGRYTAFDYQGGGGQLKVTQTTGISADSWFNQAASYKTVYEHTYAGPGPDSMLLFDSYGPKIIDGGTVDDSTAKFVEYYYDAGGRVTDLMVTGPEATLVSSFEYDSKGMMRKSRAPERGRREYDYYENGLVRVERHTGIAGEITYTYDTVDRLKSVVASGDHPVVYGFTYKPKIGLLEEESGTWAGGPGPVLSLKFQVSGSESLAGAAQADGGQAGYSRVYIYEPDTLLLGIVTESYTLGAGVPVSFATSYFYDGYGNVESMSYDNEFEINYYRDALGRVTRVTRTVPGVVGETEIVKELDAAQGPAYFPDGTPARTLYGDNILADYYQLYAEGIPAKTAFFDLDPSDGDTIDWNRAPDFDRNEGIYLYAADLGGVTGLWMEDYLYGDFDEFTIDNYNNPLKLSFGINTNLYEVDAAYDKEQRLATASYNWVAGATGPITDLSFEYDSLGNRTSKSVDGSTINYNYDYGSNRL
ncbi:MAG: RHS repeat domain-containing protein, partial [Planctomycetota bacterium]